MAEEPWLLALAGPDLDLAFGLLWPCHTDIEWGPRPSGSREGCSRNSLSASPPRPAGPLTLSVSSPPQPGPGQ